MASKLLIFFRRLGCEFLLSDVAEVENLVNLETRERIKELLDHPG